MTTIDANTLLRALVVVCAGTFCAAASAGYGLDTRFGQDGLKTAGQPISAEAAADIQIDNAGRIIIAGGRDVGDTRDILVVRMHPDGSLDDSFGQDGTVRLDLFGHDEAATAVVVDDAGYLVAGKSGSKVFVVALDETGAIRPGFGTGGIVEITVFQGLVGPVQDFERGPRGQLLLGANHRDKDGEETTIGALVIRLEADGTAIDLLSVAVEEDGEALHRLGALAVGDEGRVHVAGGLEQRLQVSELPPRELDDVDPVWATSSVPTDGEDKIVVSDTQHVSSGDAVFISIHDDASIAVQDDARPSIDWLDFEESIDPRIDFVDIGGIARGEGSTLVFTGSCTTDLGQGVFAATMALDQDRSLASQYCSALDQRGLFLIDRDFVPITVTSDDRGRVLVAGTAVGRDDQDLALIRLCDDSACELVRLQESHGQSGGDQAGSGSSTDESDPETDDRGPSSGGGPLGSTFLAALLLWGLIRDSDHPRTEEARSDG